MPSTYLKSCCEILAGIKENSKYKSYIDGLFYYQYIMIMQNNEFHEDIF